jgi:hypothetical protein
MAYARSAYIACGMPNSGGIEGSGSMFQNSHVPSVFTLHGATGQDALGVDFVQASAALDMAIKQAAPSSMPPGGYVVDCNHGGGYCGAPTAGIAAQWQFCMDHPFGVSPDPYNGMLPSTFPSYCVYQ